MEIALPDDAEKQSVAAGYAIVEQYIHSLVRRDRERLAIEEGIAAMIEGKVQDFDDFDREFRIRHRLAEQAPVMHRIQITEPAKADTEQASRGGLTIILPVRPRFGTTESSMPSRR